MPVDFSQYNLQPGDKMTLAYQKSAKPSWLANQSNGAGAAPEAPAPMPPSAMAAGGAGAGLRMPDAGMGNATGGAGAGLRVPDSAMTGVDPMAERMALMAAMRSRFNGGGGY